MTRPEHNFSANNDSLSNHEALSESFPGNYPPGGCDALPARPFAAHGDGVRRDHPVCDRRAYVVERKAP
ncbi:MAG: hypothetical protein M3Q66_09870, partial [Chloroflexota bacterium]|nr:hypothetical protein [Chloroflexota bacterium]